MLFKPALLSHSMKLAFGIYTGKAINGRPDTERTISAFKSELASSSRELRALRDAAFSLKHGRLTSGNRVMSSASQMTDGANVLGYFRVGDKLGGQLIFLDLTSGRTPARDIVAGAYNFLKPFVESLSV